MNIKKDRMKNRWFIVVRSLVLAAAMLTSCDALRIDEDLTTHTETLELSKVQ